LYQKKKHSKKPQRPLKIISIKYRLKMPYNKDWHKNIKFRWKNINKTQMKFFLKK
jgi:hypothetical protein